MTTTNEMVAITGNTYPVKDKLKSLGARWNGAQKCWMISPAKLEQAQTIVSGSAVETGLVGALRNAPAPVDMVWSDEQTAIFNWFATGLGNLVVTAYAGTGKTTTIKQAFTHAPEQGRLLYAVFNKKNQKEAQEKITDRRVEVRTLHSLGFYYIKNIWQDAQPDDNIEVERIKSVAGYNTPDEVVGQVERLLSFCKNLTVGIPEVPEVMEIADSRGIILSEALEKDYPVQKLAQITIEAMKLSLERDSRGRVSFNDMVWLPVAVGWVQPTFELVVVDEAQDMNMPQLLMATKSCKPEGRICIVGDDRQAIYGFRGAAPDGMKMMKDKLKASQLGLTVTYRCPKNVVRVAQSIVKDYTAAPTAPEGEVLELTLDSAIESLMVNDAVISRLNAPLMGIALGLLRKGTPARIEGRDIGKQLISMVRKFRAKSVPDFLKKLSSWATKQAARAQAAGGRHVKSKIEQIKDQHLTLETVAEGCENVEAIEARITGLFQDSDRSHKPAVVCSSVHKAKGLEWNRVCLISSTFKNKSDEGEEANIYYVAVTRAKKTLILAL